MKRKDAATILVLLGLAWLVARRPAVTTYFTFPGVDNNPPQDPPPPDTTTDTSSGDWPDWRWDEQDFYT